VSGMTFGHLSVAKRKLSYRAYTKKDMEQLDVLIKDIQADPKRVRLLQILGHQLELLINEGRPDLHFLYTSLRAETVVSEEEYSELMTTFALEDVSYLCGFRR
jgi:hypothetical protein